MRLQVRSLASLSGLGIGVVESYGVGCRFGLDLALLLLWLWRRLAATAPIGPLACEPPYAVGETPEKAKKKKKKSTRKKTSFNHTLSLRGL